MHAAQASIYSGNDLESKGHAPTFHPYRNVKVHGYKCQCHCGIGQSGDVLTPDGIAQRRTGRASRQKRKGYRRMLSRHFSLAHAKLYFRPMKQTDQLPYSSTEKFLHIDYVLYIERDTEASRTSELLLPTISLLGNISRLYPCLDPFCSDSQSLMKSFRE